MPRASVRPHAGGPRESGCRVIARLWHGWTTPRNADAYENFLRTTMFPSIHRVPGYLGADLFRRDDGGEVAFITITRFESLESVRAFAGDDYETAVYYPKDDRYLVERDDLCAHYEVR